MVNKTFYSEAVSGPVPLKEKEPCTRVPLVWVCFACRIRA